VNGLTDWRYDLVGRLEAATGYAGFAYPPPSITPPAVILLPGANYVSGPRHTGCLVDTSLTVRLVTDVQESSGAFDDLDAVLVAALEVLAAFETVNVSARTYGESRWWVADVLVTGTATLPLPTRNPRAAMAPS
jgi:hypothetical protein